MCNPFHSTTEKWRIHASKTSLIKPYMRRTVKNKLSLSVTCRMGISRNVVLNTAWWAMVEVSNLYPYILGKHANSRIPEPMPRLVEPLRLGLRPGQVVCRGIINEISAYLLTLRRQVLLSTDAVYLVRSAMFEDFFLSKCLAFSEMVFFFSFYVISLLR